MHGGDLPLKLTVAKLVKNSMPFTESDYSITSTQETMADPHPETNPVHILCKFRINVILPPMSTNYLFNLLMPSGYVMHSQFNIQ
jgi:hypothetical protein